VTPPRTTRHPVAGPASSGPTVTAVVRTADVLTFLAQAPPRPVGVTEIANGLGLSKAVVFRILISLQDRGYVDFDPRSRRYLLGPKSLALGMAYLERTDIRRSVHDALVNLSARSEETATLSLRTGWQRMYVDQVLPPDDIKMVVPIGRLFPLHAGASSFCLRSSASASSPSTRTCPRSPRARSSTSGRCGPNWTTSGPSGLPRPGANASTARRLWPPRCSTPGGSRWR